MKWEYCWGESIFAHRYQSGFPHAGNMPRSLVFQLILITQIGFVTKKRKDWLPPHCRNVTYYVTTHQTPEHQTLQNQTNEIVSFHQHWLWYSEYYEINNYQVSYKLPSPFALTRHHNINSIPDKTLNQTVSTLLIKIFRVQQHIS